MLKVCPFTLSLGVKGSLRPEVVALPGLFYYFSVCVYCVWNGAGVFGTW